MAKPRNPPDGYHAVTPWIVGSDTAGLLAFLTRAFGAEELARMEGEGGAIVHAEARIGDSVVMAFDARADWPAMPALLRLYVDDTDAATRKAEAAGAELITRPTTLAFGDRVSRVRDPFGNIWWIQSRVEELDEAEVGRRMQDEKWAPAMEYVQQSLAETLAKA